MISVFQIWAYLGVYVIVHVASFQNILKSKILVGKHGKWGCIVSSMSRDKNILEIYEGEWVFGHVDSKHISC